MKNFIDFVVDTAKDSDMANEFHTLIDKADHNSMSSWLKEKGYIVNENDCKKIIDNKDEMRAAKVGFMY